MLAVLAVVHLICTCIQIVKPSPVGEACHLFVLSICLDISIMNSTPLKYPWSCFFKPSCVLLILLLTFLVSVYVY